MASGREAPEQTSCSSPAKADSAALVAVRSLKCVHACGLLRKQLNTHIYDFTAFESRGTAVDNNHLLAQRQQTTARTFLLQSHQPWLSMID